MIIILLFVSSANAVLAKSHKCKLPIIQSLSLHFYSVMSVDAITISVLDIQLCQNHDRPVYKFQGGSHSLLELVITSNCYLSFTPCILQGTGYSSSASHYYSRPSNQCTCCQLYYDDGEGLIMTYDCRNHEYWMCTKCAFRHQLCQVDKSAVSQASLEKLEKKI